MNLAKRSTCSETKPVKASWLELVDPNGAILHVQHDNPTIIEVHLTKPGVLLCFAARDQGKGEPL
jgi:hypothetical protein